MTPRKHRAARDRPGPPPPRAAPSTAPRWAIVQSFEVRAVTSGKPTLRCPGCQQLIEPGAAHLVVWPVDDPDERRHWHTECWRRELKRRR